MLPWDGCSGGMVEAVHTCGGDGLPACADSCTEFEWQYVCSSRTRAMWTTHEETALAIQNASWAASIEIANTGADAFIRLVNNATMRLLNSVRGRLEAVSSWLATTETHLQEVAAQRLRERETACPAVQEQCGDLCSVRLWGVCAAVDLWALGCRAECRAQQLLLLAAEMAVRAAQLGVVAAQVATQGLILAVDAATWIMNRLVQDAPLRNNLLTIERASLLVAVDAWDPFNVPVRMNFRGVVLGARFNVSDFQLCFASWECLRTSIAEFSERVVLPTIECAHDMELNRANGTACDPTGGRRRLMAESAARVSDALEAVRPAQQALDMARRALAETQTEAELVSGKNLRRLESEVESSIAATTGLLASLAELPSTHSGMHLNAA